MKMNFKISCQSFFLLFLSSILMMFSEVTHAACRFVSNVQYERQDINFGNVIVQRDAPVGSVVWSGRVQFYFHGDPNGEGVYCTPEQQRTRWDTYVNQINYGGDRLLDIGVPGLALRLNISWPSSAYPRISGLSTGCTHNGVRSLWCITSWGSGRTLDLVKVAPVTGSGPMNVGAELLRQGFDTDPLILTQVYIGAGSQVTTVACSVTTPTVNVTMGPTHLNSFTGNTVGSTSPAIPFSIGLNCDARTRVNLTMDGVADASGVNGVIALNPTSNVASGIGLQLLSKNVPISLGTEFLIGTPTANGPYTIPLTARYYQTAANVISGEANASASFTMTYK